MFFFPIFSGSNNATAIAPISDYDWVFYNANIEAGSSQSYTAFDLYPTIDDGDLEVERIDTSHLSFISAEINNGKLTVTGIEEGRDQLDVALHSNETNLYVIVRIFVTVTQSSLDDMDEPGDPSEPGAPDDNGSEEPDGTVWPDLPSKIVEIQVGETCTYSAYDLYWNYDGTHYVEEIRNHYGSHTYAEVQDGNLKVTACSIGSDQLQVYLHSKATNESVMLQVIVRVTAHYSEPSEPDDSGSEEPGEPEEPDEPNDDPDELEPGDPGDPGEPDDSGSEEPGEPDEPDEPNDDPDEPESGNPSVPGEPDDSGSEESGEPDEPDEPDDSGSEEPGEPDEPDEPNDDADEPESGNPSVQDDLDNWFYGELPFVEGYPDETFRPDNSITRAEAITIMYNLFGEEPEEYSALDCYSDAPKDHWAVDAITWAINAGIIDGYEDLTIRADNAVTRAELTVMIANLNAHVNFISTHTLDLAKEVYTFEDSAEHWVLDGINFTSRYIVLSEHILKGVQSGDSIKRRKVVNLFCDILDRQDAFNTNKVFSDVFEDDTHYGMIMNAANGFSTTS